MLETYPQNDFETGRKKVEEENVIEGTKQAQIEEEIKEYEEALHRIKLRYVQFKITWLFTSGILITGMEISESVVRYKFRPSFRKLGVLSA